jgi:CheY-like chemotaxis protein
VDISKSNPNWARARRFISICRLPQSQPIGRKGASKKIARGRKTILLVDDEDMVLAVGAQLLERLGYTVFSASSGREAIDLFQKKANAIDLVILDIVMPIMSGSEVYDRLKAIDPRIKVLLSSGYSIDGQAREILDRGCNGFIQKLQWGLPGM